MMDKLKNLVEESGAERSDAPVGEKDLAAIENAIGVKIGPCLAEYLLVYGYLARGHVELYGVTARQGLESNLVRQTVYLHKYFKETEGLIAIENQGEGDYFLVDSQDRVFEFDSEMKEMKDVGMSLEEYIISRVGDSGVTSAVGDNGFHFTR